MKMKTLLMAAAVASAALTVRAAYTVHPYTLPEGAPSGDRALGCQRADKIVAAGGQLELGQWYTDWATCKKWCEDNDVPCLFVWGNKGCVHCYWTERVFVEEDFRQWAAANDAGKIIYCYMANGDNDPETGKRCPDQEGSAAYNWMWHTPNTIGAYPFVSLYWKGRGNNGNLLHLTGDAFCSNLDGSILKNEWTDKSLPQRALNIEARLTAALAGWHPTPPYSGGTFLHSSSPHDRLEAESSTDLVNVEIVRESVTAYDQVLTVSAPGKTTATVNLHWNEGQLNQVFQLAGFRQNWYVEGQNVTLQLFKDGEVMSTVTIACGTPANSAVNPDFTGCAGWGVWTMDLDAAKAKARNENGYTLVCVQGSQWCPDCYNVEKNFLGDGRFAAWAASKKIALVTVDIPNFAGSVNVDSPCLLKRAAYAANPEGTGATPHSGAGYLTRKGIDDNTANAKLASNYELVTKMTSEGGLNRPEERDYKGRVNRTGAPIFVLLDSQGNVRAELVRLAEDSPTDASNYANYLKRFEEMLDIAANNPTEIENNYASAGSVQFTANGQTESARLCNADMYDTFRLPVSGNVKQTVVVKGKGTAGTDFDADCEVTVEFQKIEGGKAVTVGTAKTGTLGGAGVANEFTFTEAGTYYVQVRGWGTDRAAGYNSNAFKLTSNRDLHFQNYEITQSVTLEPQTDRATYPYPAGAEKSVRMKLVKNTRYYITGMASCAGLQDEGGDFYTATVNGEVDVALPDNAGTLAYQIWKPGTLGFTETSRVVPRSICDAEVKDGGLGGKPLAIKVARADGKSGAVSARVTVDLGRTQLDPERYWLCAGEDRTAVVQEINLQWGENDAAEKPVYIYIDDVDAQLWDGNGTVFLQVESDDGITAGKGVFTLAIQSEVIVAPGKAVVTRSEPALAGKKIYATDADGAKIWVSRTEGVQGVVAGVLQSSVAGVTFTTENPRDLEDLNDIAPDLVKKYKKYKDAQVLYWSAGEGGEKYVKVTGIPAGKTATISFLPIGSLGGGKSTVSIVSSAADAPCFRDDAVSLTAYRYVAQPQDPIPVLNTTEGGVVTFKKVSGSLPSGLKVTYDATARAMVLSGAPTVAAKAYSAVFQVAERRGRQTVAGRTVALSILVRDLVTGKPDGDEPINPAIKKSRTFKNVPVFNANQTEMIGLLQCTIPQNGRASAKVTCAEGTASFSAKNWSGFDAASRAVTAELAGKNGRALGLEAYPDGSIRAAFRAPEGDVLEGAQAVSEKFWSKTDSALAWKGYYTVAVKHKRVVAEDVPGLAPLGDGYLTLKMDSTSACNAGTFTVAGLLPDGTKVSCSTTLALCYDREWAVLPIFKKSSKDVIAMAVGIAAEAQARLNRRCVDCKGVEGRWTRTDKKAGSFEVGFNLYGSYYDKNEDLGGCCAEDYGKTELTFYVDGKPFSMVKVTENDIKSTDDRLTCKFNRSTGVLTGKLIHPDVATGKWTSYAGIVVNGWGNACGCGNYDVYLPFVSGNYQYSEKGLKIDGSVSIDVEKDK